MTHRIRRLALTLGCIACLGAPGFASANIFGTGDNGVFSEQQRFDKDKEKDKDKGSQGGSWDRTLPASIETPINQVPEPETLGLVAIGLLAAWATSRRRKD